MVWIAGFCGVFVEWSDQTSELNLEKIPYESFMRDANHSAGDHDQLPLGERTNIMREDYV